MARKPDLETEKKAFTLCLIRQLNDALYQISLIVESKLDLIEKVKDKDDFNKVLLQLSKFAKCQSDIAASIAEHVESLKENAPETEKMTPTIPQVH